MCGADLAIASKKARRELRGRSTPNRLAAGQVYEAEAVLNGDKVSFRLRDADTVLTYKDLPSPYLDGNRQNLRIEPG